MMPPSKSVTKPAFHGPLARPLRPARPLRIHSVFHQGFCVSNSVMARVDIALLAMFFIAIRVPAAGNSWRSGACARACCNRASRKSVMLESHVLYAVGSPGNFHARGGLARSGNLPHGQVGLHATPEFLQGVTQAAFRSLKTKAQGAGQVFHTNPLFMVQQEGSALHGRQSVQATQ